MRVVNYLPLCYCVLFVFSFCAFFIYTCCVFYVCLEVFALNALGLSTMSVCGDFRVLFGALCARDSGRAVRSLR